MRVQKVIDEPLKTRHDLIQIMDAAAAYLSSRDTDAGSQAVVMWKLWASPDGKPWIALQLDDQGYYESRTFAPSQLADDNRNLRLVMIWNDVLSERTRREVERVNELIRQYQGD